MLGSDKNNFFKCVNSFLNDSKVWDVRSLFPEDDEKAAAEKIAEFFNAISNEYQPMDLTKIPVTFSAPVPLVDESAVITLLKDSKKPNSRVPGDMFPNSVKRNYKELALPLTNIINSVLQTKQWPDRWKTEYQTCIPKNAEILVVQTILVRYLSSIYSGLLGPKYPSESTSLGGSLEWGPRLSLIHI